MTRGEQFCYGQITNWMLRMGLVSINDQNEDQPLLGVCHGLEPSNVIDLISNLLTYVGGFADKIKAHEAFAVKLNLVPAYDRNGKFIGYTVQKPEFSDIPNAEVGMCLCATPKEERAE